MIEETPGAIGVHVPVTQMREQITEAARKLRLLIGLEHVVVLSRMGRMLT